MRQNSQTRQTGAAMKIACIGNMNNNFFSLARYLRDRDLDATVVTLNYEPAHFHPSADSLDNEYEKICVAASWGDLWSFINWSQEKIEEDLKEFDFLIGCGSAPAFLHRAGLALDVLSPYGSEWGLAKYKHTKYGDYPFFSKNNFRDQRALFRQSRAQLKGMKNARYFLNRNRSRYDEFRLKGKILRLQLPTVYSPFFNSDNAQLVLKQASGDPVAGDVPEIMKGVRQRHYPVLFHHVAHIWKNSPDEILWKGNDILINGFADFVRRNPSLNPCLVTCEYGPDVDESKKLIAELEIEDKVRWLPFIPRKYVMFCLDLSDIVGLEFHFSAADSGGIHESLVMGKPIIQYRDDRLYQDYLGKLNPILAAKTPSDVSEALQEFVDRPDHCVTVAQEGRDGYDRLIKDTLDELCRIIKNVSRS